MVDTSDASLLGPRCPSCIAQNVAVQLWLIESEASVRGVFVATLLKGQTNILRRKHQESASEEWRLADCSLIWAKESVFYLRCDRLPHGTPRAWARVVTCAQLRYRKISWNWNVSNCTDIQLYKKRKKCLAVLFFFSFWSFIGRGLRSNWRKWNKLIACVSLIKFLNLNHQFEVSEALYSDIETDVLTVDLKQHQCLILRQQKWQQSNFKHIHPSALKRYKELCGLNCAAPDTGKTIMYNPGSALTDP